jgi:macrolide-specific efflux system membrane fusion protein
MKPRTAIFLLVLAPIVLGQDAGDESAPGAVARKGTIRETLNTKGSFVPAEPAEIELDLKAYRGELKLIEVKEHGALVNAGDIVARLDTKAIDRQIESEQMSLERAEWDWAYFQEKQRMQAENDKARRERAERAYDRARAKLDGFLKHEKEFDKENERLSIEGATHRLENQHDELTQLEKMYSEDELVDATEEIVLKRSRRSYTRAKAYHELNERRRTYRKEFFEAWKEEDLRLDVEGQKRSLEHTLRDLQLSATKAKLDADAKRYGLDRAREKFADLKKDREQFVIRAPRAGQLIHAGAPLKAGSNVRSGSPIATVAEPGKLKVETTVAEKDIFSVKGGMACEITPAASAELKLMGGLSVDPLPGKGGFGAEIRLQASNRQLRPGMTCQVSIVLAEARDAVLVPVWAVQERDGKKFVKLATGAREVTTGISDGKEIAVTSGLEAGERVLK